MRLKSKISFKKPLWLAVFLFLVNLSFAQFTRQDSLRGSITPERAWWDLNFYELDIEVDPEHKSIKGSNTVHYKVLKPGQRMQIDLQKPLKITQITQNNEVLTYTKEGSAYFIDLKNLQQPNEQHQLKISYEGKPKVAKNPPWDGGITWTTDKNGKAFIASSCQGIGASIWWPNKDHMYDEPDSMSIKVTVPKGLINVSNGRLIEKTELEEKTLFHWFVKNPINNYGVNINIGDYVNFREEYYGENGLLDMDYWVLRDNLEKAKTHFADAKKTIEAFEYWFGPYPFYEDSYKLVEAPYLGMEHQSSVTYGNQYQKGYLGRDLSGTGHGLKFDFIIIHESGHEWFANNVTYADAADMWIHESFTAYSEALFLEYHYSRDIAAEYLMGTRRIISNDRPIIGNYGVNDEGSSDMYYKGANMLHTLRQLVEDDELWRELLRAINRDFKHQTILSSTLENYISEFLNKDLSTFFDQYLRTTKIPRLRLKSKGNKLTFQYFEVVEGFDMPVKVLINGKAIWIFPNQELQQLSFPNKIKTIEIDKNFLVHAID